MTKTSAGRIRRGAAAVVAAAAVSAGAFVTLAPLSPGHRAAPAAAVGPASSVLLPGASGPDPYLLCVAYGKAYGICLIPAPSS